MQPNLVQNFRRHQRKTNAKVTLGEATSCLHSVNCVNKYLRLCSSKNLVWISQLGFFSFSWLVDCIVLYQYFSQPTKQTKKGCKKAGLVNGEEWFWFLPCDWLFSLPLWASPFFAGRTVCGAGNSEPVFLSHRSIRGFPSLLIIRWRWQWLLLDSG